MSNLWKMLSLRANKDFDMAGTFLKTPTVCKGPLFATKYHWPQDLLLCSLCWSTIIFFWKTTLAMQSRKRVLGVNNNKMVSTQHRSKLCNILPQNCTFPSPCLMRIPLLRDLEKMQKFYYSEEQTRIKEYGGKKSPPALLLNK